MVTKNSQKIKSDNKHKFNLFSPKNIGKYNKPFIVFITFATIGAYLVFSSSALTPYTTSDITAVKTLGIYPGFGNENGKTTHEKWENLLGRKITVADANLDHNNWQAFGGSSWGNFENTTSLFRNRTDVTPAVTIPLRVSEVGAETTKPGGPELIRKELQDTANGLNDARYRTVAERLIRYGQAKAILRLGHEPEINYYPWSFKNGNEDVYIKAFRRVVDVFRSTPGNEFLIDYQGDGGFASMYTSPRTGITQPYGDAGYPGDAHVDIIGVDVYNRGPWSETKRKLDYTLLLAKKHNKPMSIPEWGLWADDTGDDPTFIQNMYDWINTTPKTGPGRMVYHSYFIANPNATLEKAPNSKAKFIELFSEKGNGSSQPDSPISKLPDVIVVDNSIKYSPDKPVSGDNVSFKATIKNIGTAPTPEGIKHGISFNINGKQVSWSDNSTKSLLPGESRELTANGGPDGDAFWLAIEGRSDITAIWDNVNRINESNELNNGKNSSIDVLAGSIPKPEIPPQIATVNLSSNANVDTNSTTTVDVNLNSNGATLKTVGVRITYDPTRLDFVGVDETMSAFTGVNIPLYVEPGLIEISKFDVNGISGANIPFAKIEFATKYTLGNTIIGVGPSFLYQETTNIFNLSGSKNSQINIIKPIDTAPPTSRITTKPNGIVRTKSFLFKVDATDNLSIERVALQIVGGNEIKSDNSEPYELAVDTSTIPNGNYQIQAIAYDSSGNKTTSTPSSLKIRLTDINRDGKVEIGDLTAIISSWNQNNNSVQTNIAHDLDDDGIVGINDLTKVISEWGL